MITNAPSIKKLEGTGYQVGGSIGRPIYGIPASAGAELNIIPDSALKKTYYGGTGSIGIGTPGGEFHAEWGETATWNQMQFNMFDVEKGIYINNGVVDIKIKKLAIIILLFYIFTYNVDYKTSAMNTGFDTESVNSEDQKLFLSNIKVNILNSNTEIKPINCFDVSDEGKIALGINSPSRKSIYVYDSQGKFEYGYSFDYGGSFGVEWDHDNLLIYFVRSDIAVLLDRNATCLEMKMISNNTENNSYWNHDVFAKKRSVGKDIYEIKNNESFTNFFASSYSQLIKTDRNGQKTTLYNANSNEYSIWVVFLGAIIFVIITVVVVIMLFRKQGSKKGK
ncbi:MAG: hypothetical protein BGN88_12375 [Clostridiales bacterium 43-6]|nr:MAG: hypothetical protein BGN88_12375 [Clostridiales bacterium 43-6]